MPTVYPKKGRFYVALGSMDPSGSTLQDIQQKNPDTFKRGEQGFASQSEAEKYREELKVLFDSYRQAR